MTYDDYIKQREGDLAQIQTYMRVMIERQKELQKEMDKLLAEIEGHVAGFMNGDGI